MQVVPVGKDKRLLRQFIGLPFDLYRDDPAWVPPLRAERCAYYDRGQNPFFEHAEAELFLAMHDGRAVGRISAQADREHLRLHRDDAGFFGSFESVDDPAVARALFAAAETWLEARGLKTMRGPYTLNINDEAGLLVDGYEHPPMFLTAHHLPYYRALVEDAGFTKVKELYCWRHAKGFKVPELARRIAERTRRDPALKVRTIDMRHYDRDLRTGLAIFNEAWRENWGFVPLTESEIRKAAKEVRLILDPRIILLVEYDGKPVGMLLAIPNINLVFKRIGNGRLFPFGWAKLLWGTKVRPPKSLRLTLLGLVPEFRGLRAGGLSVRLYCEILDRGYAAGYEWGELSWTLDDNEAINNGSRMMQAERYKTYHIYERPLPWPDTRPAAGGRP